MSCSTIQIVLLQSDVVRYVIMSCDNTISYYVLHHSPRPLPHLDGHWSYQVLSKLLVHRHLELVSNDEYFRLLYMDFKESSNY